MAWAPNYRGNKSDRENSRAARRQLKAARLAQRRVAKLQGVDIDSLPEDYRGVARTLANGEIL